MRTMILLLAILLIPLSASAQAAAGAESEVREAVRGFHAALAAGDSLGALGYLHPEVSVYEGGHAETYDQYRSGHLAADIAFARAVDREVTHENTAVLGDAALYTSESHTTGQWRDREVDSHGTETIALVRTPEGWRIRHIHWSSR